MQRILLFLAVLFLYNAAVAQQFVSGYYHDASGNKIAGSISLNTSDGYILFKTDPNNKAEKVEIKNISSIVTTADSIVVLNVDNNERKRYFAEPYFKTPTTSFYYKTLHFSYGGTPQMSTITRPTSTNSIPTTTATWTNSRRTSYSEDIIMYSEGSTTYELTKRDYIEILSKAMADAPELVKRIQNKEFKFKDIKQLIKIYRRTPTAINLN